MKRMVLAASTAWSLVAGSSMAQPPKVAPASRTLSVARIVSSIPEGQLWGRIGTWLSCSTEQELAWNVGRGRLDVRGFEQPVRAALEKDGYPVTGDAADPFVQIAQNPTADIAIGGVITSLNGKFCRGVTKGSLRGTASLEMNWQIFSTIQRRVIATVHTQGEANSAKPTVGAIESTLIAAMDMNVGALIASDAFKNAIASEPRDTVIATPIEKTALPLPGSLAAKPMPISDAIGSVVLILSGDGHGSGFLASSDGYVLTAQHVVGTDKYVKIRWSDGLEGVGEIIRSDKRRDVALIKTDPRGRAPLALHRATPEPGATVFAIGAPLDVKLQSTVTRGVVSANRIENGFSFIQSDVTVNAGNSGGPLLDEKGQVLGLTDFVRTDDEGSTHTGLNFFVPIGDALLFLKAEPH